MAAGKAVNIGGMVGEWSGASQEGYLWNIPAFYLALWLYQSSIHQFINTNAWSLIFYGIIVGVMEIVLCR